MIITKLYEMFMNFVSFITYKRSRTQDFCWHARQVKFCMHLFWFWFFVSCYIFQVAGICSYWATLFKFDFTNIDGPSQKASPQGSHYVSLFLFSSLVNQDDMLFSQFCINPFFFFIVNPSFLFFILLLQTEYTSHMLFTCCWSNGTTCLLSFQGSH